MSGMNRKKDDHYLKQYKYNERIRMKTGTFLHTYCPECRESLIKDNMIQLIAVSEDGSEGILELSPYLNVFEHHSTIDLQPRTELKDLKCPHCRKSLVLDDVTCGDCGARTARLLVSAVHIKVPFLICLREGCHWHGITPEDEQLLIKDACDEW